MDGFAGYLHNPFGYSYQSEIRKQAVDRAKSHPDIDMYLFSVVTDYLGDRIKNKSEGLVKQYKFLHEYITEKQIIGYILYGADGSITKNNRVVSEYTTINQLNIDLTVQSICYYVLKEFVKEENIDRLCKIYLSNKNQ